MFQYVDLASHTATSFPVHCYQTVKQPSSWCQQHDQRCTQHLPTTTGWSDCCTKHCTAGVQSLLLLLLLHGVQEHSTHIFTAHLLLCCCHSAAIATNSTSCCLLQELLLSQGGRCRASLHHCLAAAARSTSAMAFHSSTCSCSCCCHTATGVHCCHRAARTRTRLLIVCKTQRVADPAL
jgi:hypothetical protein